MVKPLDYKFHVPPPFFGLKNRFYMFQNVSATLESKDFRFTFWVECKSTFLQVSSGHVLGKPYLSCKADNILSRLESGQDLPVVLVLTSGRRLLASLPAIPFLSSPKPNESSTLPSLSKLQITKPADDRQNTFSSIHFVCIFIPSTTLPSPSKYPPIFVNPPPPPKFSDPPTCFSTIQRKEDWTTCLRRSQEPYIHTMTHIPRSQRKLWMKNAKKQNNAQT